MIESATWVRVLAASIFTLALVVLLVGVPTAGRRPADAARLRLMSRNRARLAIGAGRIALVVGLGAAAVALARPAGPAPSTAIEIDIHYSHFEPSTITVPVGVPVTITLRNNDPIDHEWIVGDAAVQAKHRTGTELLHPSLPTELVIPAGETRVTTITFERPARSSTSATCPATRRTAWWAR